MHRGAGISRLSRQQVATAQYKTKGNEVAEESMKQMAEQLALFKKNLEEFANKYKNKIRQNPEFRQHFNEMCTKIGVDPLASQKGFWAELLGVGDFYYELGVQIVEVCLRTRAANGGIIELTELRNYLQKMRGQNARAISQDDVERAIKKLKLLGNGFNLLSVGPKKMVQSVPCELNIDHTTVLLLAQDKGFITVQSIISELQWDSTRIDSNLLMQEGIAWVDLQHESGQPAYWFPSLVSGSLDESVQ